MVVNPTFTIVHIVDEAAALVGETLTAVQDNIGGNSEIGVDDTLDALAAMLYCSHTRDEFWLFTGDADATPPKRMAYCSASELD